MSEDQDKESKTELPTDKKQQDALEKGNAPVSREVAHAAFFATLLGVLITASGLAGSTAVVLRSFIERPGEFNIANASDVGLLIQALSMELAPAFALVVLVFLVAGVAATVVQTPPRIALDRITPKAQRISLKSGWQRITGAHGLAELLKGLLKILAVGVIGALYFWSERTEIVSSIDRPHTELPGAVTGALIAILWPVVIVSIVFAGLDILWTRWKWADDLRMTKQEVRDEARQQEGDPIVQSRRRAVSRARSRKRMMSQVANATLVVANPTHFAVAMRYVRSEGGAPVVVAKGADLVALEIRRIAEEKGIPVVEDKMLARSLFDAVKIDQAIPPVFYRAVAEILIVLQRGRNRQTLEALRA